VKPGDFI